MVIVSPSDIIVQEGKDSTMNTTCAIGPRHNLFGGGIVSSIDSWHQINRGDSVSIKQESSPHSQDSESGGGSPYSSGYYASYEDKAVDESNNNQTPSQLSQTPNQLSQTPNQLSQTPNQTQSQGVRTPEVATAEDSGSSVAKGLCTVAKDAERQPSGDAENHSDALLRLQLALQRAAAERPLQQIQCPFCPYITATRPNLELHVQQSHEDQRSCSFCDFTADSSVKLLEHVRESHATHAQFNISDGDVRDDEDEPGLTVPKINSQGKVKTFRCKQCDFSAVTKLEFWDHTRGHIKSERLLTCPRCPFVTEYKHHLEYHLRNHFGSKPFKCDKCQYSCVNKSMLNSHLKSHSNIYQFSCADCNYATKYCHSLKLHLRKYDHKPAMVLNPDGSPNPLPIIDVYGTRRGPKMKNTRNIDHDQNSQPRTSPQHTSTETQPQQLQPQQQQPSLLHPFFASAYGLPYYNPLLHPLMYQAGNAVANHDTGLVSSVANHDTGLVSSLAGISEQQQQQQQEKANFYFNNNNIIKDLEAREDANRRFSPNMQMTETTSDQRSHIEDTSRALDLSCWDASQSQEDEDQSTSNSSPPPRIAPPVTQERRRKGKAYKLDTLRQERTLSEDDDDVIDSRRRRHFDGHSDDVIDSKRRHLDADSDDGELPLKCVLVEEETSSSPESSNRMSSKKAGLPPSSTSGPEAYNCNYCDITFRDVVMYTMHMGYHGYGNPYTCNMCGETTTDRVSFFLHIARTPHS
ncbi:protein hunchback [Nilaparvata lugens]|uniref:protein hunchback n=1 Tax=Nilaparvata lugens TaxID=108931 RepID=UPI00193EABA1|nr:protein hunchback [Nilaparvata lugens]